MNIFSTSANVNSNTIICVKFSYESNENKIYFNHNWTKKRRSSSHWNGKQWHHFYFVIVAIVLNWGKTGENHWILPSSSSYAFSTLFRWIVLKIQIPCYQKWFVNNCEKIAKKVRVLNKRYKLQEIVSLSMFWPFKFTYMYINACTQYIANASAYPLYYYTYCAYFSPETGLLDSLTTTADSKDCPGICVHSLATIICYEVLEDIQCPSANMKCCVESNNATLTSAPSTTQKPVKVTNTPVPVTKPTHKVEKPIQSESSKTKGTYWHVFIAMAGTELNSDSECT